jgi:hypothetical protein
MSGESVPFSHKGNLIHQVGDNELPQWRPNEPFQATLNIDWLEPGATIKRVIVLRDVDSSATYPMFVDDIMELLRNSVVDHGRISGTWRVKKTGRKNILYTLMKVGD